MDFLHRYGPIPNFVRSSYAMLDVVYVVIGLLFFALMGWVRRRLRPFVRG